jgi:hypothetical protein
MSAPSFSKDIPNKIGRGIEVSGKNTLVKTGHGWRFAIADEPIDAKADGKRMFCVRVDKAGDFSQLMIGFTPMETFDSSKNAYFGDGCFTGCGFRLDNGYLYYAADECHDIIDGKISRVAKEIIVILTISKKGTKKEIRFLCDGKETQSSDVSKHLKGDLLFPAICLGNIDKKITTILIDQIKTRTPEIERLIKEEQNDAERERFTLNALRQVVELRHVFLQQAEIHVRAVMAKMKFELKI